MGNLLERNEEGGAVTRVWSFGGFGFLRKGEKMREDDEELESERESKLTNLESSFSTCSSFVLDLKKNMENRGAKEEEL